MGRLWVQVLDLAIPEHARGVHTVLAGYGSGLTYSAHPFPPTVGPGGLVQFPLTHLILWGRLNCAQVLSLPQETKGWELSRRIYFSLENVRLVEKYIICTYEFKHQSFFLSSFQFLHFSVPISRKYDPIFSFFFHHFHLWIWLHLTPTEKLWKDGFSLKTANYAKGHCLHEHPLYTHTHLLPQCLSLPGESCFYHKPRIRPVILIKPCLRKVYREKHG